MQSKNVICEVNVCISRSTKVLCAAKNVGSAFSMVRHLQSASTFYKWSSTTTTTFLMSVLLFVVAVVAIFRLVG